LESKIKGGDRTSLSLGGIQKVSFLTEKGLYRIINRSNKPIAEKFQDWVERCYQRNSLNRTIPTTTTTRNRQKTHSIARKQKLMKKWSNYSIKKILYMFVK